MKVILNRDVPNLGEEGDVINVSPGYARNYLLPGGMVMQHNSQNLSMIESRRVSIEKRKAEKRQDADSLKEKLENEALTITMMAGENGRLFGSVTSATIVDELEKKGIFVERKRVDIPDSSLKAVGNYKVRIRLYGEQEAVLNVQVEGQATSETSHKGKRKVEAPAAAVVENEVEAEAVDEEVSEEESTEEDVEEETEETEE